MAVSAIAPKSFCTISSNIYNYTLYDRTLARKLVLILMHHMLMHYIVIVVLVVGVVVGLAVVKCVVLVVAVCWWFCLFDLARGAFMA